MAGQEHEEVERGEELVIDAKARVELRALVRHQAFLALPLLQQEVQDALAEERLEAREFSMTRFERRPTSLNFSPL